MATPNPSQVAAKWAQNLSGATQRIQQGVEAVTVSPGQAAARQKAAWAQNVVAAQDKWASRVASVSLQDWQNAFTQKGIPRIASGATAAQPKFEQFMNSLLPYIQRGVQSLPARGNLDQNIARLTAFVRHMANFKQ